MKYDMMNIMGTKWNPEKLANHRGMLGKTHNAATREAISKAQRGRQHGPQEGFQKGHAPYEGTEVTRFQKGQPSPRKGTGSGTELAKQKMASYRANAKRRGHAFELTVEAMREFLSRPCSYCGGPSTGVDRVDNALGYVVGNMVSCCGVCNHMKWNLSKGAFLEKCRSIVMCTGYEI